VFSFDQQNDPDILGMIGASAALAISKIPFQGPLGACRVSRVNGQLVVNPTYPQREQSDFNLVLAGRRDAMNMIEVDAREAKEEAVTEAIALGQTVIAQVCDMIARWYKCGGRRNAEIETDADKDYRDDPFQNRGSPRRHQITQKAVRVAVATPKTREEELPRRVQVSRFVRKPVCPLMERSRKNRPHLILEGKRPDGRSHDRFGRSREVGLLPRAHGSALFTARDRRWSRRGWAPP
jgi:polyribonucleotide nucleotidyltransferase